MTWVITASAVASEVSVAAAKGHRRRNAIGAAIATPARIDTQIGSCGPPCCGDAAAAITHTDPIGIDAAESNTARSVGLSRRVSREMVTMPTVAVCGGRRVGPGAVIPGDDAAANLAPSYTPGRNRK